MSAPTSAREALIVEALGEVARLLDRVESLTSSIDVARLALAAASAQLDGRLTAFESGMALLAQQAKVKTVEHILQRTGEAARQSIAAQSRAMSEAARVAFTDQVDSVLARFNAVLQQFIQRTERPWYSWLSHAATAVSSAAITWLMVTPIR